jgi:hypothetical protein
MLQQARPLDCQGLSRGGRIGAATAGARLAARVQRGGRRGRRANGWMAGGQVDGWAAASRARQVGCTRAGDVNAFAAIPASPGSPAAPCLSLRGPSHAQVARALRELLDDAPQAARRQIRTGRGAHRGQRRPPERLSLCLNGRVGLCTCV